MDGGFFYCSIHRDTFLLLVFKPLVSSRNTPPALLLFSRRSPGTSREHQPTPLFLRAAPYGKRLSLFRIIPQTL